MNFHQTGFGALNGSLRVINFMFVTQQGAKTDEKWQIHPQVYSVKYLLMASFNEITKGLLFSERSSADLG
jgi:hypothetical protein